jgi:two-component system, OmpR family, copper resistance phosphate regulon response regulator CusR
MTRILIVDDEPGITSFLEKGFAAAGFTTMAVHDGREAAAIARDESFDVMVLDLGLPSLDGLSVLRMMRARGERMPVIILSARGELDTTIAGFEGGANDYMVKPFRFEELLARVRVRLQGVAEPSGPSTLRLGALELDLLGRSVRVDGRAIDLSAREFALAETFFRHAGQVLSREQLLDRVWGYDFDTNSNVVEVYVGYLRKKLPPGHLETVRGMGYRFVAPRADP